MRMYRVTEFSPDVLREATLRGEDVEVMMGTPNWDALLDAYAQHYAMTLWHDDQFVMCGGVMVVWAGVGEAWVLGSPDVAKHGKQVYKMCKQGLDAAEKHFNLRRIQATVIEVKFDWIRFAKVLGFKKEGTMFGYGPDGKDYALMARYKGWDRSQ